MFTPSDQPIQATLTLTGGSDVLGYVSQCECCGQRAITLAPHGSDWVCPRCAEVAEPSPYVETGQDIGGSSAAEIFPQRPRWTCCGGTIPNHAISCEFSILRSVEG